MVILLPVAHITYRNIPWLAQTNRLSSNTLIEKALTFFFIFGIESFGQQKFNFVSQGMSVQVILIICFFFKYVLASLLNQFSSIPNSSIYVQLDKVIFYYQQRPYRRLSCPKKIYYFFQILRPNCTRFLIQCQFNSRLKQHLSSLNKRTASERRFNRKIS